MEAENMGKDWKHSSPSPPCFCLIVLYVVKTNEAAPVISLPRMQKKMEGLGWKLIWLLPLPLSTWIDMMLQLLLPSCFKVFIHERSKAEKRETKLFTVGVCVHGEGREGGGGGRRDGEAAASSLLPFMILLFNSRPEWLKKTNLCNLATGLLHIK